MFTWNESVLIGDTLLSITKAVKLQHHNTHLVHDRHRRPRLSASLPSIVAQAPMQTELLLARE